MRRVQTWEFADFRIIINTPRPPQVRVHRDPSSIKRFALGYITVFPAYCREFFYEFGLSLLYPKRISSLLLSLVCLLSQLGSIPGLLKLFAKLLHQLPLRCQINFAIVQLFALLFSLLLSIFKACL